MPSFERKFVVLLLNCCCVVCGVLVLYCCCVVWCYLGSKKWQTVLTNLKAQHPLKYEECQLINGQGSPISRCVWLKSVLWATIVHSGDAQMDIFRLSELNQRWVFMKEYTPIIVQIRDCMAEECIERFRRCGWLMKKESEDPEFVARCKREFAKLGKPWQPCNGTYLVWCFDKPRNFARLYVCVV